MVLIMMTRDGVAHDHVADPRVRHAQYPDNGGDDATDADADDDVALMISQLMRMLTLLTMAKPTMLQMPTLPMSQTLILTLISYPPSIMV